MHDSQVQLSRFSCLDISTVSKCEVIKLVLTIHAIFFISHEVKFPSKVRGRYHYLALQGHSRVTYK